MARITLYKQSDSMQCGIACIKDYVDDDDDEVLDVYGIRDWVENLPEKRVTISSLANHYNIIGL